MMIPGKGKQGHITRFSDGETDDMQMNKFDVGI